jgi:general secretion pathway protein A
MRQLSQRIARRFELHPLSPSEVQDYIERRLSVATDAEKRTRGERTDCVRFTPAAVRAVAGISGGIPRVINTVCDQALEIGFEEQTRAIDRPVVVAAARRLKLPASMGWRLPIRASLQAAAALVLASGALAAWWWSEGVPRSAALPRLVTPTAARATTPAAMAGDARRTQPGPPVPLPDAVPPKPLAPRATAGRPPTAEKTGGYEISVAAFRTAQRAEEVADAIAQRGLPVSTRSDPTGAWHLIVVGPLNSSDEAESAQRALARQGFAGTKISATTPDGR